MRWWKVFKGSRRHGPPFLRWHPHPDPTDLRFWRVCEEDTHRIVARGMSRADAEEVARDHNARDPIRSWADWWEARNAPTS